MEADPRRQHTGERFLIGIPPQATKRIELTNRTCSASGMIFRRSLCGICHACQSLSLGDIARALPDCAGSAHREVCKPSGGD